MLKDELWTRRVKTEAEIAIFRGNQLVEETILLDEIQKNNIREQVQKELEKEDGQTWKENRMVYMEEKVYVSNNWKIQEQILQENHEPADVGYSEQQRMLKLIKRNYWWPGIRNDIKKYV